MNKDGLDTQDMIFENKAQTHKKVLKKSMTVDFPQNFEGDRFINVRMDEDVDERYETKVELFHVDPEQEEKRKAQQIIENETAENDEKS